MIEKIVRPGSVLIGKRHASVFCKIEWDGEKLLISGVIGPHPSGSCRGGCGQIDGGFAHRDPADDDARTQNLITPAEIRFAEGWDAKLWLDFLDVWKKHHLNNLTAGCEHQRALGWDKERLDPGRPPMDYDKFYPEQEHASWNLKGWVRAPHGYLCAPCPVCGYEYGTKWLRREVPEEAIEFLEKLPAADRACPWRSM